MNSTSSDRLHRLARRGQAPGRPAAPSGCIAMVAARSGEMGFQAPAAAGREASRAMGARRQVANQVSHHPLGVDHVGGRGRAGTEGRLGHPEGLAQALPPTTSRGIGQLGGRSAKAAMVHGVVRRSRPHARWAHELPSSAGGYRGRDRLPRVQPGVSSLDRKKHHQGLALEIGRCDARHRLRSEAIQGSRSPTWMAFGPRGIRTNVWIRLGNLPGHRPLAQLGFMSGGDGDWPWRARKQLERGQSLWQQTNLLQPG